MRPLLALCLTVFLLGSSVGCRGTTIPSPGEMERRQFAIFLLDEGTTPHEAAGMPLASLPRRPEPVISESEIVAYDAVNHQMQLTRPARDRINELPIPTNGLPFVVCLGEQNMYWGAFWTPFSSLSFDGVVILPLMGGEESILIQLGYPGSDFFRGDDPRSMSEIIQSLSAAGLLSKSTTHLPVIQ